MQLAESLIETAEVVVCYRSQDQPRPSGDVMLHSKKTAATTSLIFHSHWPGQ